jgi:hypothetical protein
MGCVSSSDLFAKRNRSRRQRHTSLLVSTIRQSVFPISQLPAARPVAFQTNPVFPTREVVAVLSRTDHPEPDSHLRNFDLSDSITNWKDRQRVEWMADDKSQQLASRQLSAGGGAGSKFVARSFSGDKKQLLEILKVAISHRGAALIDVILL